jgi:hypothetical protein
MTWDEYVEIEWESGPEKYSRQALHFTDHQSQPRLMNISKMTKAILFDSIENSHFTISLSDSDNYLTNKLQGPDRFITGKTVRYRTVSNIIFTGMVASFPEKKGRILEIKVDIFYYFKKTINKTITESEFPNAPIKNKGKWINYIYGNGDEEPDLFEAFKVDDDLYLAAGNPMSDILSYNWHVDPVNDYTYIDSQEGDDIIKFSGKGPKEQGVLIDNPAEMLNQLLIDINSSIQIENLSQATSIFEDRNYTGNALFVTGKRNLKDIFTDFQRSFNCFLNYRRDGKVEIRFLQFQDATASIRVHPTEIKGFKKWRDTKRIKKKWQRKYLFSPAANKYLLTPTDVSTSQLWNDDIGDFEQKFIETDSTSWDAATRNAYLFSNPLLKTGFSVHKKKANNREPGDVLEFKHPDAFHPDEYRMLFIERIETSPSKESAFCYIEGFDINELQGKTFKVYPAGDPKVQTIYESDHPDNPQVWWSN